jgi:hypothetical protein
VPQNVTDALRAAGAALIELDGKTIAAAGFGMK